jgi:hypothetical protein
MFLCATALKVLILQMWRSQVLKTVQINALIDSDVRKSLTTNPPTIGRELP